MSTESTANQWAQRKLAEFENEAERWMREESITPMVAAMMNEDNREGLVEELVKQAFIEGAMRVVMKAMDDNGLKL